MEHTPQWSVLLKTEPPPGPPPVILCRRKQMLCGSYVVSYCLPATTVLIFILIQKLNKRSGENCRAEFRCCKAPTRFPEHLLPSKKKKNLSFYLYTYLFTYLPPTYLSIYSSIHSQIHTGHISPRRRWSPWEAVTMHPEDDVKAHRNHLSQPDAHPALSPSFLQ